MSNIFLSSLSTPPRGNKSLASQLGYCFTIILVILIVISNMITSAYTAVLEQDRADGLQSAAEASAVAVSHLPLQEGMTFPIPVSTYKIGNSEREYIVNIYKKAGNSYLRVYSSNAAADDTTEQVTLEGASVEYQKAFEQQEAVVTSRTDSSVSYTAGVAPIIGEEGTVSGLIEIMMPFSDFSSTVNGLSLSWIFTMVSIAVALTMVYFETNRLLNTMLGQPDRQLPKIIRYGLSGCQSIAFFSAMACTMPPLVISSYLMAAPESQLPWALPAPVNILLGGLLFAYGFFGFRSLRVFFVRRFTTRISLIIFIFIAFMLLLISSVFSNVMLYFLLLLPIGFCLGMVFYFQREYRIYASRLGYEDFSERKIHITQYTGYVLGACVGAVMAGIIYERFGILAVSIICGCILFIVGIQALLFVQHCPPSSTPPLHLPNFLYALSSKKSGTFIWSALTTAGIQLAFFFLFVPEFLQNLGMSLATVSFYYILFFVVGIAVMRLFFMIFPEKLNMQSRILISAVLQISGLLLLAFIPTAKVLVVSVVLFGAALGLHEFRFLDYYREMIREDKQVFARDILERAFALGVSIGAAGFGAVFLFDKLSVSLLIFALFLGILLFAYPLTVLLYTPSNPGGHMTDNRPERPDKTNDPYLSSHSTDMHMQDPYGTGTYGENLYGQDTYGHNMYGQDQKSPYEQEPYGQYPNPKGPYAENPYTRYPYESGKPDDGEGEDQ